MRTSFARLARKTGLLLMLCVLFIPPAIPASEAKVTVYQHCGYEGYGVHLPPGKYSMEDLLARGVRNDDLSSIRVPRGYTVTIYEHDFRGRSRTLTQSDECLIDSGFNDIVSSISVSQTQPASGSITVLTYNTHLFGGSSTEIGAKLVNKPEPLVFDDDNRARRIAKKIESCGADIVALQEVWAYKRQQWFVDVLKDVYPYSYRRPKTTLIKTSSGLVLLSKYKLTDIAYSRFPERKGFLHEEDFSTKGVISATVEPWPGGPTFRVGISHAYTNVGGKDQQNISQLAAKTVQQGPAIMMGDLNVPSTETNKYETMRSIFESVGAIDAYRKVHKGAENAFTVNWKENPLHRIFAYDEWEGTALDYVFVKESGSGLTLIPEHAEVIRDWRYVCTRWMPVGGNLSRIAVGSAKHVWGVNSKGNIWRRDGNAWTRIEGSLAEISVARDGTVWGVNRDGEIWRRDGDKWTQVGGNLSRIAVGSAKHVWGVNSKGNIWRRDGNAWTRIEGSLAEISVARDGTVWGVNRDGEIWRRDGDKWTQVGGNLSRIAVGSAKHVWGVNSKGNIWRRDGNAWTRIEGSLAEISVASDGTVWGVNRDGEIWHRDETIRMDLSDHYPLLVKFKVVRGDRDF